MHMRAVLCTWYHSVVLATVTTIAVNCRQVPCTTCTMQPYCETYKVCRTVPVCVPVCVPANPCPTPCGPTSALPDAADWRTAFRLRLATMGAVKPE